MLRDYQEMLANKACEILKAKRIVYCVMEMRVGKTLIALRSAELLGCRNVLFITKKKAKSSIESDYRKGGFKFNIDVINYEQAKKCEPRYDLIVVDEAHSLGAFPKPSQRTIAIKKLVGCNYLILLSGTPSPESESQLYHQFWISEMSPFAGYRNFYKWAKDYVFVKEMRYNGIPVKDYKKANRTKIMSAVEPYLLRFTQKDAGFVHSDVQERVRRVPIRQEIHRLVDELIRKRYYKFKDGEEVICDTAVKLQSKIHQIYSGTVKTETGKVKVLDTSKAVFIKNEYSGRKFAVFYKFKAEGDVLKELLPNWTESPDEFNKSDDKVFVCQIVAGAMGINLATADVLLFYNIDFSSVLYWQARARLSGLERGRVPEVHWIFADGGIEGKIYKVVQNKKDYTLSYFVGDYLKDERSGFTAKDNGLSSRQRLCV